MANPNFRPMVGEPVLCPKCDGLGFIQWQELVDYHKGDYSYHTKDCTFCNNKGVVIKIVKIEYRPLTENELTKSKRHNA